MILTPRLTRTRVSTNFVPFMKSVIPIVAVSMMLVSFAASKPVDSPEDAVDVFRAVWRQSLAKKLVARPFIGQLKQQVVEEGKVTARLVGSESRRQEINSLSADDKGELLLFGVSGDLMPDRKVWSVTHPGAGENGFEALIDAENGDLLFFWILPLG